MTPQTAILKLRLRLNKLHSSDYDDIPDWTAVEAINKAALERTRRMVHGTYQTQDGDEETRMRVDDLQFLLSPPTILKGVNKKLYFESEKLPEDYLFYKSLRAIGSNGECTKVNIHSMLVEESNAFNYLSDWSMQPSFEWRQTFHTLAGNRVLVYTNNQFLVNSIELKYFRRPKKMDIHGYTNENGQESQNVDLEFKDDMAEIILDDAAAIIAGSIDSFNQHQINKQRADNNN